jgi:hypothetical protein
MLEGNGPTYETTVISAARNKSYAKLTAEQQVFYLTQEGEIGERALKTGDFKDFEYPVRLIFGKSVVGGSVTGDVFEKLSAKPLPFVPVRGYKPEAPAGLSFEVGDPWRFYRQFWNAHDIDRIAGLIPEAAVAFGQTLHIAFTACNNSAKAEQITIAPEFPPGWTDKTPFTRYPVESGECYPLNAVILAPANGEPRWQQLSWKATAGGQQVGAVNVRVYVGRNGGLPQ